jgi:hypothetical protein
MDKKELSQHISASRTLYVIEPRFGHFWYSPLRQNLPLRRTAAAPLPDDTLTGVVGL